MTDAPSRAAVLQAKIALGLLVVLLVVGAVWYGVSAESLGRMLSDIRDRPGGPMTFRFILQPAMAVIAALRDGVKDARLARPPYFSAILRVDDRWRDRLWEGILATARILILGVVMDTIYQISVLRTFYPGQAAVVAVLLAFLPYLLLRGPINRIARRWFVHAAPK